MNEEHEHMEFPEISSESLLAEPLTAPRPPAPRRRRTWVVTALVLLGALLGGALGTSFTWAYMSARWPAPGVLGSTMAVPVQPAAFAGDADAVALFASTGPGVVQIVTNVGAGTGFIVDGRGYIVTNYHVVADAKNVRVRLDDGTLVTAEVMGRDPSFDLAVVRIDPSNRHLVVLPLGDSDRLRTGEPVVAIGFPLSEGKSISAGIVSGLGRKSQAPNDRTLAGLIQTDAAINPGNSGGPLIDAAGRVIGVNTQIASPVKGFTGIGFAIPINTVKAHLADLISGRQIEHPWLGISGAALSPELSRQFNLKVDYGVLVHTVMPDSPAMAAELRPTARTYAGTEVPGDIIIAVDGRKVMEPQDITAYLDTRQVGDTVTVTIVREGEQIDLAVILQAWPKDRLAEAPQTESIPLPDFPDLPFFWPWRR